MKRIIEQSYISYCYFSSQTSFRHFILEHSQPTDANVSHSYRTTETNSVLYILRLEVEIFWYFDIHVNITLYLCLGKPLASSRGIFPSMSGRLMNVEQFVERELAAETEVLGENSLQCHSVHHKSYMTWPQIEPGHPEWEAFHCLLFVVQLTGGYRATDDLMVNDELGRT
jgi:hypothetical protein